MSLGWISLHRSIMDSETFSRLNAIQQLIAIYIILNANHEDGIWYDRYKGLEVPVKRGQLITSRKKIMNEWFKGDKMVTEQKIRTTLKKLESLSFITCESTNNYTLIEVVNYNVYQDNKSKTNQQDNQGITKEQPRDNQGITTNNNVNNVNNVNKDTSRSKLKFETHHFQLAELLFKKIRENNNQAKKPNLDKWANTIRLMTDIDQRSGKEIQDIILFSQSHHFWYKNIMSADKLRQKFDRLVLERNDSERLKTPESNEIDWRAL